MTLVVGIGQAHSSGCCGGYQSTISRRSRVASAIAAVSTLHISSNSTTSIPGVRSRQKIVSQGHPLLQWSCSSQNKQRFLTWGKATCGSRYEKHIDPSLACYWTHHWALLPQQRGVISNFWPRSSGASREGWEVRTGGSMYYSPVGAVRSRKASSRCALMPAA